MSNLEWLRSEPRESVAEHGDQGRHDHPHDKDGKHDHPGLPPATGSHGHAPETPGGVHAHRDGDPGEGAHPNVSSGLHIHPLAQGIMTPDEMERWLDIMVEAHFPKHKWLPDVESIRVRHVRAVPGTREFEIIEDWRDSTADDWREHATWSMHLPDANIDAHLAVFLGPDRILDKLYIMSDGSERPPVQADFEAERAFFVELAKTEPLVESVRQRCEQATGISEAFHLRGVHWVGMKPNGSCPANFPKRLKTTKGATRCYTAAAADEAKRAGAIQESEPEPTGPILHWADRASRFVTTRYCNGWPDMDEKQRDSAWSIGLEAFHAIEALEGDGADALSWFFRRGFKHGVVAVRHLIERKKKKNYLKGKLLGATKKKRGKGRKKSR